METFEKSGNGSKPTGMAGRGVHQAIDQFSEAAHPAVTRAASGAHRLVDRVFDSSNRAARRVQETGTWLKDAEQRWVNAGTGYVREHPLQSLGIALAAGFLVSRLMISRRSNGRPADEQLMTGDERDIGRMRD